MNEEKPAVIPAESDKNTETSYGKFSGPDELLKAYEALESEFTRRSQKLKEYEKAYGKGAEARKTPSELAKEYGVTEDVAEEALRAKEDRYENALIKTLASRVLSAEQMASDERVIGKVLSKEENREAVINAYVRSLKDADVPPTFPKNGGAIPTLRPYRPQTVHEAGEIARAILERL